jgi:hypothetical protein
MTHYEEKQNLKANLINDVIFYTNRLEDLWQYHPENPKKLDVVDEYNALKNEIHLLEDRIQQLGE